MVMPYDSTRPLPKAPRKLTPAKARAAIRSDIARVERWLEVCPEEDREKARKNLECLRKTLEGDVSMTLDRFMCSEGRKEESVRWDVCIFRHLEAQKSKKRSPCKKCQKPAQFVKMLVNEVL